MVFHAVMPKTLASFGPCASVIGLGDRRLVYAIGWQFLQADCEE